MSVCTRCASEGRAPLCQVYVSNPFSRGVCQTCNHAHALHEGSATLLDSAEALPRPVVGTPSRHAKNPSRHGEKGTRRATAAADRFSPAKEERRSAVATVEKTVVAAERVAEERGGRRATVDYGQKREEKKEEKKEEKRGEEKRGGEEKKTMDEMAPLEGRPRSATRERDLRRVEGIKGISGRDVKETLAGPAKPSPAPAPANVSGPAPMAARTHAVGPAPATAPVPRKEEPGRSEAAPASAPALRKELVAERRGGEEEKKEKKSTPPVQKEEGMSRKSEKAETTTKKGTTTAAAAPSGLEKREERAKLNVSGEEGMEKRKRKVTMKRKNRKKSETFVLDSDDDAPLPVTDRRLLDSEALRLAVRGNETRTAMLRQWEASRGQGPESVGGPKPFAAATVEAELLKALDEAEAARLEEQSNNAAAPPPSMLSQSTKTSGDGSKIGGDGSKLHKRALSDGARDTPLAITTSPTVVHQPAVRTSERAAPLKGLFGALGLGGGANKPAASPTLAGKNGAETKKQSTAGPTGAVSTPNLNANNANNANNTNGVGGNGAGNGGNGLMNSTGNVKGEANGKFVSPPMSTKEERGTEKGKSNPKILQLSSEEKRDKKMKRQSLSMIKKSSSNPDFDDHQDDLVAFPGVIQHSVAAGPAGPQGVALTSSEAASSGREGQLRDELLYWKNKFYATVAEKNEWQRQAEEWKDRYLESQAGGALSAREKSLNDVYGESPEESGWREEARRWEQQAVHWQEMYLQLQMEHQMSSGAAAMELPGSPEEMRMELGEEQQWEGEEEGPWSDIPRSKSEGNLSNDMPIVKKKDKDREKKKEKDLDKAKKRGSLVVLVGQGPSGCPEEFPSKGDGSNKLERELSKSEKSKAGVYRNWVEEYFWDLHQYLKHRKDRRMALENYIQSSHMSENDKLKARKEWSTKETALLRRRRVKLKADDFDHLKLIGRGAFGEVWLVRRKDTSEIVALKRIKKAHLIEKNQVESILVEREVLKGTQSPWIVHLHCLASDHQLLTNQGYLGLPELESRWNGVSFVGGLEFATLNPSSHVLEYQAATRLVRNEADPAAGLVEFEVAASGLHLRVTPEHEMYVKLGGSGRGWEKKTAGELLRMGAGRCRMLTHAPGQREAAKERDEEMDEEKRAFLRFCGEWLVDPSRGYGEWASLLASSHLEEWMWTIDAACMDEMIEGMMKAEGGNTLVSVSADLVERMAIHAGRRVLRLPHGVVVKERKEEGEEGGVEVDLARNVRRIASGDERTFCVTVPNGLIWARGGAEGTATTVVGNCSFHDNLHLYLAMEYVPGGDFRTLLAESELDEEQAKFYAAEMFLAVATLHRWGFSHRDLKPDNFLIGRTGHLKLADFGLSKGDLVREETDAATPVKFYLADGQYTTVMLQRAFTVPVVLDMLVEKLHLDQTGKKYVLVEINDGLAKRILGDDVQPSVLVLKWRVGTANRLMFLESTAATKLIQRDLLIMQEQQSKFLGSKKLGATLRRAFGGDANKKEAAAAAASGAGQPSAAGTKEVVRPDPKKVVIGTQQQQTERKPSGGLAPSTANLTASATNAGKPSPPIAHVAAAPAPVVVPEKMGQKGVPPLRAQVLKNATLAAQAEKSAAAAKATAELASPRKLSQAVLPSKDLIADMRNSVYLPRARDFTSMRQERKAVEKAVNEGKEDASMHYSVVGSPDYMAVEVLRGDGYTSCVDFWAIGCMLYEMIFGFPPFFGESPEEVFMNIVNYEQCLAFPEPGQGPEISPEGEAIIRALLTEPAQRLGARGGIKEIRQHPFFRGFPWDNILREVPPFVPDLTGQEDYSRFHVLEPGELPGSVNAEEEPAAVSPEAVPDIARAPSPDDFVDSPRDFDELEEMEGSAAGAGEEDEL